MEAQDIIKLVTDVGVSIANSAVLLYAIIKLIDFVSEYNNKKYGLKTSAKTKEEIQEITSEQLKLNDEIYKFLDRIKDEFEIDRVMIIQFHNGGYYLSGMHDVKLTATHEVKKYGIPSAMEGFKGIQASIYHRPNSPLLKGKDMIGYNDLDCIDQNKCDKCMIKNNCDKHNIETYKSLGFKSYFAFAIRNQYGQLIGKVTLVGIKNKIKYNEYNIEKIKEVVKQIETLINYGKTLGMKTK